MRKGWTERRKEGNEEASGGRRGQRNKGEEKGRSVGGREIGREGNFKEGNPEKDTGQYSLYSRQRTKRVTI